jgi:hypothetical protein
MRKIISLSILIITFLVILPMAKAQEKTSKSGFLFFNSSGKTPVQVVFVECRLDSTKTILENLTTLDATKNTGWMVPVFYLDWRKAGTLDALLFKSTSFQNDADLVPVSENDTPEHRRLSRALPVELIFDPQSTFSPQSRPDLVYRTEITYRARKILTTSYFMPAEWGTLKEVKIIQSK